jgi:hypothetical protein
MNIGQIITIHPASDYFMHGIKYAEVVAIGRKWITLYDNITGVKFRVTRFSIMESGLWSIHPNQQN